MSLSELLAPATDWASYCRFRDDFGKAIDPRYYSLEWLDERLLSGRATLFHSGRAALIVELRHYPTGAMDAHALIAAGDLQEIADILLPLAERWAAEHGCISATVESRPGWAKVLGGLGYETYQVAIRKELQPWV
jgi:hypothetical protein